MRTNKKNVSKSQTIEFVDEDGVVHQSVHTDTFQIDREPDYIKLYIQDIGRLKDITNSQNKVLLEFISSMGYNNVIPTFKPIKQMIADKLGIAYATVDESVKAFKKKGLFVPIARGMYVADPELFAKGKWSDIKNLRLTIDYNEDGQKRLSSNISEELQLKLGI